MDLTFKMWTPFHYFMMIFPFILAIVLWWMVKNKPQENKYRVGLIMTIFMVAILILRNSAIWYRVGTLNPEVFPFQVCHFANIILLLAVLSKNRVWGTIGWCLNFPAGLVSVIFADGLEGYSTIISIQAFAYIAGHMLIVTAGLYLLLTGFIKIDWQSMKKMYLYVGIGYILSVPVNSLFNTIFAKTEIASNYFYSFKPEAGTPLEDMFALGSNYTALGITFNPIYLALLAVVGFIFLTAMAGLYWLIIKSINPKHPVSVVG